MTVGELIEVLKDMSPDLPILVKGVDGFTYAKVAPGTASVNDAEGEAGIVYGLVVEDE